MPRPRVTDAAVVLDAAARRLVSHGIAGTTIDDVAAEAGISRATAYRYIGGKDELVQAVIGRQAEAILGRVATAITSSSTPHQAIAGAVSTALRAISENPLLARLTSTDLGDSLPFITINTTLLIDSTVSTLASAFRAAPGLTVDEPAIELAVEEATRFVLAHLAIPRRNGKRLGPRDAGHRAADLIAPLLDLGNRPG